VTGSQAIIGQFSKEVLHKNASSCSVQFAKDLLQVCSLFNTHVLYCWDLKVDFGSNPNETLTAFDL
jgi:hypothetical protein